MSMPNLKIKATKANDSKSLSKANFEASGKDALEWDLEYDVKERDGNLVIGNNLGKLLEFVWWTLKPSDDQDYRYMIEETRDNDSFKIYYNKY